jgi:hypothetical protein
MLVLLVLLPGLFSLRVLLQWLDLLQQGGQDLCRGLLPHG